MTEQTPPSAKDALIEAAKKHGKIDPTAHFGQEELRAKRLAVFGLIELLLLSNDDPMADVLKSYREFDALSVPVMQSEERCDTMETVIEDFCAAAEAYADAMRKELRDIKDQLGVSE